MPLTNKYLKYSPEITLEIFTLIYNKLIENKWTSINIMSLYNQFTGKWNYIIDNSYKQFFSSITNLELKETTVQEILGYDPFIKKETNPEYVECINVATCNTKVGEIFKCRYSNGSFEFEYNDKSKENFNSWDGWSVPWSDELPQKHFKPSTKEAFDAQNQPIEKWSVGSYFVIEKDRLYNISSSTRGDICIIKEDKTFNFINKKDQTDWSFDFREGSKWFATKSEAEEFAKTLVEPAKEEVKTPQLDLNEWLDKYKKLNLAVNDLANAIELANFDKVFLKLKGTNSKEKANILYDLWNTKQPLKQVVHCKTQEEWDFVTEKLGYKWSKYSEWSSYKNNTCIGLNKLGFRTADVGYKGYQILSFQEWCDLNGYKMESNQEFKIGEYIFVMTKGRCYRDILKVTSVEPDEKDSGIKRTVWIKHENSSFSGGGFRLGSKYRYNEHVRHATSEEINQHLISIGQIPASEPLNTGIEPNKDGIFKYKQTMPGASWSGGTIDNHLDVMIQSKTQSEIEFNYLPEPK